MKQSFLNFMLSTALLVVASNAFAADFYDVQCLVKVNNTVNCDNNMGVGQTHSTCWLDYTVQTTGGQQEVRSLVAVSLKTLTPDVPSTKKFPMLQNLDARAKLQKQVESLESIPKCGETN